MPTLALPALRFEDLELAPGGQRLAPPLSFEIPRGRLVALCGENGSGKTTLLRQLLRLSPLSRGQLFDESFLKKAYVPQSTDLGVGWPLTVREALALRPASKEHQKAKEALLWTLRITPLLSRRFAALSGGERQKVLCARALLSAPDLLCLDEPTSGVDAEAAEILWQRFAATARDHNAVVIVISHQSELIRRHADMVLHLSAVGLHL